VLVLPADLGGATALVIDVLRAATTIITALANGCRAIVPVADPLDARRRAAAQWGDGVLVAGERRGEPIPGFDLSNSPVDFGRGRARGKTVFFTTSNGTRALLAARAAEAIGVAALVNASAAAAWAAAADRDIAILCAGSRGDRALEDWPVFQSGFAGGAPATVIESCRSCGLPHRVGARFCRRCGQALGEPAPTGPSSNAAATEPSVHQPQRAAGGRKRRDVDGATAHRSSKRAERRRSTRGTA